MDWLIWVLAGLVLAGIELLSGTFYLLVIGGACLVTAAASYLGSSLLTQSVIFAATALAGCFVVNRIRARAGHREEESRRLQNIDEGNLVRVASFDSAGCAKVNYRGTLWEARLDDPSLASPGTYRIKKVDGNLLILTKVS